MYIYTKGNKDKFDNKPNCCSVFSKFIDKVTYFILFTSLSD